MPQQDEYDAAEVADRVADWLSERLDDATDVVVSGIEAPSETGHSSETILFDATWRAPSGEESASFVLRTRPTGHTVFPTYDLALQADVMRKVGATGAVPVPNVRWYEGDTSVIGREFLVMDRVDGVVPPDNLPYTMGGWLLESSPDEQRRLQLHTVDLLADIHAIDWRGAGLDVLDQRRLGPAGLTQQLAWFDEFLEWGRMGRPQPGLDHALAWLRTHLPRPEPDTVLNWGDSRIGNVIYRDHAPVAVLDWEMATLGPRQVDLAWLVLFERFFSTELGIDNLPGFVGPEESVARYEARAGVEVGPLGWYLVWGALRYAGVMMRLCQAAELAGSDIGFTESDNLALSLLNHVLDDVESGRIA